MSQFYNLNFLYFAKILMHTMPFQIPVFESGQIFDSKPLDKKIQLRQNDLLIRKNLSIAFSQCISSYIVSEVYSPKQMTFARPRPKTQREPEEKPQKQRKNQKSVLKKIFESKKHQIAKLATFVNQKMYDIATSVIDQYKSVSSQKSTKITKSQQSFSQTQLTQSNKNFLIQLFAQTGLLKHYKGMDRTFTTLISQAQKAYYGVKQFVKSESVLLESKSEKDIKKHISEMKEDKMRLYDAVSDIISMKKRQQEATSRFKEVHPIQEIAQSRGYEIEEYQKDSEIYQEDDYMILTETKDTRHNANEPDQSSISQGLYFSEFSSHHFDPLNEQDQSTITDKLEGTHVYLQKLVSNIKFFPEHSTKNKKQKDNQPQRLNFSSKHKNTINTDH